MATLVHDPAPQTTPTERRPATPRLDAWPHTNRVMPWLVALFMAMIYFVPVDGIILPIHLPFNAGLDRMALGVMVAIWFATSVASRNPPRFKHTPINFAIYAFLVLCMVSLVLNLRDLSWDGELTLSVKQFLLAGTYVVFFYVVASSLTREDVRGFAKLIVFLAALSAIGTVIEYRAHHDLFADIAKLFPGAHVIHSTTGGSIVPGARAEFSGPTLHGLADATLLAAGMPFAMILFVNAQASASRFRYGLAMIAIIAGCVATQEKTAIILVVLSIVVTVAYRPRRFAPYWPMLIVAAVVIEVAAPHAISGVVYQFRDLNKSTSTSDRTADYSAVAPFIDTHLLFGRGFGSFDPHKYRILDDQMLGFLVAIGSFGVLAYVAMILTPLACVHRRARRARAPDDELLAGIAAGCVLYLASNFLYDTFSFRQGPYVFFFLAALAAAALGVHSSPPSREVGAE